MLGFHRAQPTTFDAWFAIATRGLCDHARERLREELEAHYEDAYETFIANGLGELDAQTQATAELGDPYQARRRFTKIYFTKNAEFFLLEKFVSLYPEYDYEVYENLQRIFFAGLFAMLGIVFTALTARYEFLGGARIIVCTALVSCAAITWRYFKILKARNAKDCDKVFFRRWLRTRIRSALVLLLFGAPMSALLPKALQVYEIPKTVPLAIVGVFFLAVFAAAIFARFSNKGNCMEKYRRFRSQNMSPLMRRITELEQAKLDNPHEQ